MKIVFFAFLTFSIVACLAIILKGLDDDTHPADLAVVLGNKVNPDGTPSPMLKARLDQALNLYRQGGFKLILVSGGHGREGYDEPIVMRHYLESNGVPSDSIFEDNGGNTTWQTAQNTAQFLRTHHLMSVLIISQYFHIARCQLAFAKFGISPIYTSHANYWSIRDFYSVPREVIGYIAYLMRSAKSADTSPAAS